MFSLISQKTLGVSLMLICSNLYSVSGKQDSEILATFGDPIQLFGGMINNDIDFVDGLKINVYSPTNRTVTVSMNDTPLNGTFVTGTTGAGYRLVRGYSYIFKTNQPANDLIAKITIPYDPMRLQNASVDQADTYVGKLADDKKAWMVMDAQRTVQRADFKTSMSQMTSLDGEYVILGRKGTDNGNVFVPYGEGDQFSANFTGGPGRQDVEFIDGLRFAVQSDRPIRVNVALKFPISTAELPQGMMSLNSYAWVVNTTENAEINPAPAASTLAPPAAGNPTATLTPNGAPAPALPAPANSASPFVFANPAKRQQNPGAQPEPIAQPQPGSPDLPQASPPAPGAPAPAPGAPGAPAPPPPAPGVPPPPAPPAPGAPPPPQAPPPAPAPAADPPAGTVNSAMIDFPVNMAALSAQMAAAGMGNMNANNMGNLQFAVGRRPSGATPDTRFDPMPMQAAGNGNAGNAQNQGLQLVNGRLQFEGVTRLDGEYVILVPMERGLGGAAPAQQGVKKTSAAWRMSRGSGSLFAVAVVVAFACLM